MSWYQEGSNIWNRRWPIAVNNISGTSPIDITCLVPPEWPEFWDNISDLTNGDDIRVVDADGKTKLTYQLNGFVHSTHVLTLEVDNYTPPSSEGMCLIWVYWEQASAADGAGSFTPASAKTGIVFPGCPGARRVAAMSERQDATKPRAVIVKGPADTVHIWFNLKATLAFRCEPYANNLVLEEIDEVNIEVLTSNSPQAALVTPADTRFLPGGWVRVTVKAGDDGSDYTINLIVTTTDGVDAQTFEVRAALQVRDVDMD